MGTLAEVFCQKYLEEILISNGMEGDWRVIRYDDIRTDEFKSPANEYDIKINNNLGRSYSIESRSSITYDRSFIQGLEAFDIIGPYSSIAKSGEKMNDFYLRPLFEFTDWKSTKYNPMEFENYLKKGQVKLFIVAGTTKEVMIKAGYDKSMRQGATKYRVVKIINANDALTFHKTLCEKIQNSLL